MYCMNKTKARIGKVLWGEKLVRLVFIVFGCGGWLIVLCAVSISIVRDGRGDRIRQMSAKCCLIWCIQSIQG